MVEDTQERLSCLLNPNTIVMRRVASVRPQASVTGSFTGTRLSDDPLLYTGGGRTELELDLLFDVSLTEGPNVYTDVRDLTGPIWRLAENATSGGDRYERPPLARVLWGKALNLLGVVGSVAERLEQFDATGTPGRSWLRLKMIRVPERAAPPPSPAAPATLTGGVAGPVPLPGEQQVHEVLGGGARPDEGDGPTGERLDSLAARYYGGRSDLWRLIAAANDLGEPPWVDPGRLLVIPPLPGAGPGPPATTPSASPEGTPPGSSPPGTAP